MTYSSYKNGKRHFLGRKRVSKLLYARWSILLLRSEKKLEVTTVNVIALAEHEHSRAWFLAERTCHISMIIICCDITKFDTEIILLFSVSPLSLIFYLLVWPHSGEGQPTASAHYSGQELASYMTYASLVFHMLDISLVGNMVCLMPEKELNKSLLLWFN